jgi:hypothetical protein
LFAASRNGRNTRTVAPPLTPSEVAITVLQCTAEVSIDDASACRRRVRLSWTQNPGKHRWLGWRGRTPLSAVRECHRRIGGGEFESSLRSAWCRSIRLWVGMRREAEADPCEAIRDKFSYFYNICFHAASLYSHSVVTTINHRL